MGMNDIEYLGGQKTTQSPVSPQVGQSINTPLETDGMHGKAFASDCRPIIARQTSQMNVKTRFALGTHQG
jgi:hypothetical protein